MARRRNVTAQTLAAELICDVEDVIALVLAGKILVQAPPRFVTARIPGPEERGGGFDLSGVLAYAEQDLSVWLPAYLKARPPLRDVRAAADSGRPFFDGLRLYVRPGAMATMLRTQFTPAPRSDQLVMALRDARAVRGRPVGVPPDHEAALLVWWRVPTVLLKGTDIVADMP